MAQPRPADQHQAQQATLSALAASALLAAWLRLDLADLRTSLPELETAVTAIIAKFGQASAALSATYYRNERRAAGITGRARVFAATPPSVTDISPQVRWATRSLWDRDLLNKVKNLPDTTVGSARQLNDAAVNELLDNVRSIIDGVTENNVLQVGRETIFNAVNADRKAKGWARVPEPGCCSFCALLATRGAVYKSEESAGGGDFKYHDHCKCHAEPVFNAYEPTAQIREWQSLYSSIPHGNPHEMRNAFRDALATQRAVQPAAV